MEHNLGDSVWIERLNPHTCSRADLATFRLSGHTHDPAGIRHAAVLEIVEFIPSDLTSSAPTVRTLSYPIIVALVRVEAVRDQASRSRFARPDGEGDGGGNDNGGGGDPGAPSTAVAAASAGA